MTEINDLRERVESAEARFGLIDEQQHHYSERLIGLIETIESQLAAARSEIEQQISENLRLSQENEELRSMLHSMLQSIEKKTFTETLQNIEARVCALVAGGSATEGQIAQAPAPAPSAPSAGSDAEDEAETLEAVEAFVNAEAETRDGEEDSLIMEAPVCAEETAPEAEEDQETAPAVEEGHSEEINPAEVEDPAEGALAFLDEAPETEAPETEAAATEPAPELTSPEEVMDEMAFEDAPEAAMDEVSFQDAPEAAMSDVSFEDAPEATAEAEAVPEPAAALDENPEVVADLETGELAVEEPIAEAPEAESEDIFDLAAALGAPAEEAAAGSDAAPSVKEIIRRVGDLARELEKAEAQRRAGAATAESGDDDDAEDQQADPGAPPLGPPLDQAVNG